MHFTPLMPGYIKNTLKILGTNNLEFGMMKAGIVGDIHLILITYKASVQSFQIVKGSFLHILRATFICIP